MNKEEKYDCIFGNHPGEYVVNRLDWLDALLSDIRTLIDGYQCLRENSKGSEAYGAGNISIPVLVCTGLELISKLFVGDPTEVEFGVLPDEPAVVPLDPPGACFQVTDILIAL